MDKEVCGVCEKVVTPKDKGVSCEVCDRWYHINCEEVSEDTYKFLKKSTRVHWYCTSCDKGVAKVIASLARISKKQEALEGKVEELESKHERETFELRTELVSMKDGNKERVAHVDEKLKHLEGMMQDLDQKIKSFDKKENQNQIANESTWSEVVSRRVQEVVDNRLSSMANDLNYTQKSIHETREQIMEEKDRQSRLNRVILYNAMESTEVTEEEDKTFIKGLLEQVLKLGFEEQDVTRMMRLGKRSEDGKPRPLLVEFASGHLKNLVMQHAYKLGAGTGKFNGVVISHDMTRKERESCKELVAEAKRQEENDASGNWIYRVRGSPGQMKIIKIKKN